jgi:SAM-dependent methyltransferase
METLPWARDAFDVVTGFNAFQFAADPVHALREAGRVTSPGGRVAMIVWGRDKECETVATVAAVLDLLPPRSPTAPPTVPLSSPGGVEALMEQAGLAPLSVGEVDCPFAFPDLETALHGFMSVGASVAIVERVGAEPVLRALRESLAGYRTDAGGYLQRNRFRYVIATN